MNRLDQFISRVTEEHRIALNGSTVTRQLSDDRRTFTIPATDHSQPADSNKRVLHDWFLLRTNPPIGKGRAKLTVRFERCGFLIGLVRGWNVWGLSWMGWLLQPQSRKAVTPFTDWIGHYPVRED